MSEQSASRSHAFEEWFKALYIKRGLVSSKAELQEAWNAAVSEQQALVKALESVTFKLDLAMKKLNPEQKLWIEERMVERSSEREWRDDPNKPPFGDDRDRT